MTKDQIRGWLKCLGLKPLKVGAKWVTAKCPRASYAHEGGTDGNPSFGVSVRPGESRVHCFSCNYSDTQTGLLMDLRGKVKVDFAVALQLIVAAESDEPLECGGDYESSMFEEAPEEHIYPEWFLSFTEPAYAELGVSSAKSKQLVHPYLEHRRVPYQVARKLDLRFDAYRQRVGFPVRDFDGQLRGFHGRDVTGKSDLPYLMYPHENETNPHILLGEHRADFEAPLVVAESVFDLCRVFEVYENVVSPLTASLSAAKIKRLRGASTLLVLFDADKAGDLGRKRLRDGLPDSKFHNIWLKPGTDGADLTADQMWELLRGLV